MSGAVCEAALGTLTDDSQFTGSMVMVLCRSRWGSHEEEVCMSARQLRLTRFAVVASAVVVLLLTGVAPAACVGDSPEAVLRCYSEAHELRDFSVLEDLLALEYGWIDVVPPQAQLFDRETTLKAARNMLADERLESVSLVFAEGYKVVGGTDPGTWRIEDVRVTLSVKMDSADEPFVTTTCATYYVREASGNGSDYEIYREVTFEGVGCTDE